MTVLATHAAWALVVSFALSLLYEIWRTTAKAGTSRHDSPRVFVQGLVIYVPAAAVITALFLQAAWAAWAGLLFVGATLLFYDVLGWTLEP
jgi:hypothetical protein